MSNTEIDENRGSNLDSKWIEEYESLDKLYGEMYIENVKNMNVNFLYLDNEKEVKSIKREDIYLLNPNKLTQEELILLIKKNNVLHEQSYILKSIFKYNYSIDPNEVITFLKNNKIDNANYLTEIHHIEDIYFKKTIGMYLDLNVIYIIFIEKPISHNKTKRIIFNTHKKTMRKK